MNRHLAVFLGLCLIVIVVTAALVLYETMPKFTTPDSQSILWQSSLEHFATDFTVADGKMFAVDNDCDIYTYDATNGQSLWNASFNYGAYETSAIAVYEGKVYASTGGNLVKRVDENTGKFEMQYKAPGAPFDNLEYKRVPSFFLADGKLFASSNGVAVYDAVTGQELWSNTWGNGQEGLVVNNTSTPPPKSNYTLIQYDSLALQTERLDTNNGEVLWNYSGYTSGSPIVSQGQVVLWNYASGLNQGLPNGHAIVCLNTQTGQKLWSLDTDAPVFQPTIANGLLFFGAQDGYFYALNMADGSLKWKTNIDSLGLIASYNRFSSPEQAYGLNAPPPLVNTQNQRIFWNIFTSSILGGDNSGAILSLNLQKGNLEWLRPINSTSTYSVGNGNMALLNNQLFISGNSGLLCLSANSGSIQWERSFYHYVSSPILEDNTVFVTADLYLIAYK